MRTFCIMQLLSYCKGGANVLSFQGKSVMVSNPW